MKYHTTKLDSRYTGAQWFYCRVQIINEDKVPNFFTARNWCWETFGPSCEVDLIRKLNRVNPNGTTDFQWAWKRDVERGSTSYFIYLTEPAHTAFTLKWTG